MNCPNTLIAVCRQTKRNILQAAYPQNTITNFYNTDRQPLYSFISFIYTYINKILMTKRKYLMYTGFAHKIILNNTNTRH